MIGSAVRTVVKIIIVATSKKRYSTAATQDLEALKSASWEDFYCSCRRSTVDIEGRRQINEV